MMKANELVEKVVDIAKNYETLYVMGCFGAPMTAANKARYTKNHSYNKAPERVAMINAASPDTFGFDCVNLIKGVLWGWNGDKSRTYGGASYSVNGVPDIGADQMIKVCSGVSSDFSGIVPGAAVWTTGHIGVYIGGGLAVECTPKWANKVQITAVANIGAKAGYNARTWKKWGKLPYVDYTAQVTNEEDFDMDIKEARAKLTSCADTGDTPSAWAREAAEYCKRKGIFNGDGAGNYGWQQPITREAVAQIIYNALEAAGALDNIPDR